MPMGTLMKKIHCQPSPSTSAPRPAVHQAGHAGGSPPHAHRDTRRRCGGKIWVIVDKVCGVEYPGARPLAPPGRDQQATLPESPHHIEATVNTTRPIRYRFFAPNRSPSRRHERHHAYPSRYALVTQTTAS